MFILFGAIIHLKSKRKTEVTSLSALIFFLNCGIISVWDYRFLMGIKKYIEQSFSHTCYNKTVM